MRSIDTMYQFQKDKIRKVYNQIIKLNIKYNREIDKLTKNLDQYEYQYLMTLYLSDLKLHDMFRLRMDKKERLEENGKDF